MMGLTDEPACLFCQSHAAFVKKSSYSTRNYRDDGAEAGFDALHSIVKDLSHPMVASHFHSVDSF